MKYASSFMALSSMALALTACQGIPRDPDGTSDRIRQARQIRVGLVPAPQGLGKAEGARLLARLGDEMRARPRVTAGATEPLLRALDRGELDLVLSPFAPKTPWSQMVALGPPIAARGQEDDRIELRAAMRNGENRWIMTVEKAARAVAAPDARS